MTELIPGDNLLLLCNETELLGIAWKQGLGHLRRGIPFEELVQIVAGGIQVRKDHLSETVETRSILQRFIDANWGKIRSQLPGCNGKCSTFSCTEGKHALCFYPNKALLR